MASLQAQHDIKKNGITYDHAMNHLAFTITNNNMSSRFVNQVQVNHNTRHGNGCQGGRGRFSRGRSGIIVGTTLIMVVVEEVAIEKVQIHGPHMINGTK